VNGVRMPDMCSFFDQQPSANMPEAKEEWMDGQLDICCIPSFENFSNIPNKHIGDLPRYHHGDSRTTSINLLPSCSRSHC
jgi:hypothetical protein